MTAHPSPVHGVWRNENDARMLAVLKLAQAVPPQGSTAALAHREQVQALEVVERASHPSILLIPLIAALLQLVGIL